MKDSELNQPVLEAVTLAANEAAAEFKRVLERELGALPQLVAVHEQVVDLLFQYGYHAVTGSHPDCGYCGGDDHAEYACPDHR